MANNDVVLSAALRNNLLSLQGTQRLIDTVQLRLATGLKVNSALDGPSQFFTSQSLNNRAGDLGRLLDGINLSIRSIQEADTGVTALTKLVQQAESIGENAQSAQAAAAGFASITSSKDLSAVADLITGSGTAIAANNTFTITAYRGDTGAVVTTSSIAIASNDTIYTLAGKINSAANATINPVVQASVDSNGHLKLTSLIENSIIRMASTGTTATPGTGVTASGFAYLGLSDYVTTENSVATTRLGAGSAVAGDTIYSRASAAATVNGLYQSSATLAGAGFVTGLGGTNNSIGLGISINGTTTTINLPATTTGYADTTTIQQVVDAINAANLKVAASFNTGTGKIELKFGSTVSSAQIILTAGSGVSGTSNFGFGTRQTDQTLATNSAIYSENFTFVGSSSTNIAQYKTDFNNIRTQIDKLVQDANFQGVNLLGGDTLSTFFNEDRTSSLDTVGKNFTASGLGITAATFLDTAAISTSLAQVRSALDQVRDFGQSISNSLSIIQTRRDFTESTIATLKAGAGDLVNADQNEEGANLLALQTRQQLGVTALSLAAQSQQSVLRLF